MINFTHNQTSELECSLMGHDILSKTQRFLAARAIMAFPKTEEKPTLLPPYFVADTLKTDSYSIMIV